MNYPRDLENLLQEYLTDNYISDKERAVLLRKAESYGINRDEFDLYIDAQLQKAKQNAKAAEMKSKGRTCPHCGASIPQLADACPECNNYISTHADDELKQIIEQLESSLIELESGKNLSENIAKVESYKRKAKLYYGSNPKVKLLLQELDSQIEIAKKRGKQNYAKRNIVILVLSAALLIEVILYFALHEYEIQDTIGLAIAFTIMAIIYFFLFKSGKGLFKQAQDRMLEQMQKRD